jgi:hypothetical protein
MGTAAFIILVSAIVSSIYGFAFQFQLPEFLCDLKILNGKF